MFRRFPMFPKRYLQVIDVVSMRFARRLSRFVLFLPNGQVLVSVPRRRHPGLRRHLGGVQQRKSTIFPRAILCGVVCRDVRPFSHNVTRGDSRYGEGVVFHSSPYPLNVIRVVISVNSLIEGACRLSFRYREVSTNTIVRSPVTSFPNGIRPISILLRCFRSPSALLVIYGTAQVCLVRYSLSYVSGEHVPRVVSRDSNFRRVFVWTGYLNGDPNSLQCLRYVYRPNAMVVSL